MWRPTVNGKSIEPPVYKESMIIEEFPDSLCVQLKRFNNSRQKINNTILFENCERIDLSYLGTKKDEQTLYRVTAFESHIGDRIEGGHYIAYRLVSDGHWYAFDDDRVNQISKEEAYKKMGNGYLFVLTRVSKNNVR